MHSIGHFLFAARRMSLRCAYSYVTHGVNFYPFKFFEKIFLYL